MKNGSNYTGAFINGEITGKGTKTYEDGMIYTGEWKSGERNGYGQC